MDENTATSQHAETLTSLREHYAAAVLRGDDPEVIRIAGTYKRLTGKLLLAVEQDDGSAIAVEV